MTAQPLDPAAIMAAHQRHAAYDDGACKPWVASRGSFPEHCHTYRLAEALQASERALAAERAKVERVLASGPEYLGMHAYQPRTRYVCHTHGTAECPNGGRDCNYYEADR